jgi:hypothetical protein
MLIRCSVEHLYFYPESLISFSPLGLNKTPDASVFPILDSDSDSHSSTVCLLIRYTDLKIVDENIANCFLHTSETARNHD